MQVKLSSAKQLLAKHLSVTLYLVVKSSQHELHNSAEFRCQSAGFIKLAIWLTIFVVYIGII